VPYYVAAQIVSIKHPAEGKASKEILTENVARLKMFWEKPVNSGGSQVPGGLKQIVKYNWMVVFRY
jgi:hypothetical protein